MSYIYIYISREREREREISRSMNQSFGDSPGCPHLPRNTSIGSPRELRGNVTLASILRQILARMQPSQFEFLEDFKAQRDLGQLLVNGCPVPVCTPRPGALRIDALRAAAEEHVRRCAALNKECSRASTHHGAIAMRSAHLCAHLRGARSAPSVHSPCPAEKARQPRESPLLGADPKPPSTSTLKRCSSVDLSNADFTFNISRELLLRQRQESRTSAGTGTHP